MENTMQNMIQNGDAVTLAWSPEGLVFTVVSVDRTTGWAQVQRLTDREEYSVRCDSLRRYTNHRQGDEP